jgi:hypothetical protein
MLVSLIFVDSLLFVSKFVGTMKVDFIFVDLIFVDPTFVL